jgi:hypothetical protein
MYLWQGVRLVRTSGPATQGIVRVVKLLVQVSGRSRGGSTLLAVYLRGRQGAECLRNLLTETVTVKSTVQLELVGRLPRKPGGRVGHMTLYGKHVLLANEDGGFQVVDVSKPAAPTITGWYRPRYYLGPVAASGDHAYVVEKDDRLRVLNVSDRGQPRAVGLSKLPDQIWGLVLAGTRVYASMCDSLRVLDVSDPMSPREVGVCGDLELARRVTVAGNYAYMAADFNGMRIIDVSNPAKPREIGSFEGPGNVTKIAIVDQYAYLADYC